MESRATTAMHLHRRQPYLKSALIEALENEHKARATYRLILRKFGPVHPFVNKELIPIQSDAA